MYKNLCFSGGHIKTITFLGALRFMNERGLLKNVQNFIGSSAGAIVALVTASKISFEEMERIFRWVFTQDTLDIKLQNFFDFHETFGLDHGNRIYEVIELVIQKCHHPCDVTFIDFVKKTGSNIVICGSNITKQRLEYFDVNHTPNMRIVDALRISVSVPFIFKPFLYQDCLYVDAGIFDNFPIHYFKNTRHLHDTLGINVLTKIEKIENVFDFAFSMVHAVIDRANYFQHVMSTGSIQKEEYNYLTTAQQVEQQEKTNGSTYHVCHIEVIEGKFFDFHRLQFFIDETKIEDLISKGYHTFKDFYCALERTNCTKSSSERSPE